MTLVCKFMSTGTYDCVCDDGVGDGPVDVMEIVTTWLTSNVETAKAMAEFELESEGQWMDDEKPANLEWRESSQFSTPKRQIWAYVDPSVANEEEMYAHHCYGYLVILDLEVHHAPPIEPASSFAG